VIVHAGLVALNGPCGWRGALLTGPSGVGKSDLALRCLDLGLALVADDRVNLWRSGGHLYGEAPDALYGLIEMRGLGIARRSARAFARVTLVADCATGTPIERLPESAAYEALGIAVPLIQLASLEASAAAKLRHALIGLGYQA